LLCSGISVRYAGAAIWRHQERDRPYHNRYFGHAPAGGVDLWFIGGPLWSANSADGQRNLFFGHRASLRICTEFHGISDSARAVWHRHGRRVGGGRFAGYGSGAGEMAWRAQRDFAERLFDRVSAGGHCGTVSVADVGLAPDVLDRRTAGVASFV